MRESSTETTETTEATTTTEPTAQTDAMQQGQQTPATAPEPEPTKIPAMFAYHVTEAEVAEHDGRATLGKPYLFIATTANEDGTVDGLVILDGQFLWKKAVAFGLGEPGVVTEPYSK